MSGNDIVEIEGEADGLTFEDFKDRNGMIFWWASDVCRMLGYKDVEAFGGVIRKVARAFTSLDIDPFANIVRVERDWGGLSEVRTQKKRSLVK